MRCAVMKVDFVCACFFLLGCLVVSEGACPVLYCFTSCEHGYFNDTNGCLSCSCRSQQDPQTRNCQDDQCFVPCARGYELNATTSCLTCDCAPETAVELSTSSSDQQNSVAGNTGGNCNRIACLEACGGGYENDSQGCPTCVCKSSGATMSSLDADKSFSGGNQPPASSGASTIVQWSSWLTTLLNKLTMIPH